MYLLEFRWEIVWAYKELYIRGVGMTLIFTIAGISLGLIIGLLLGLAKMSNKIWIKWPAVAYIDFFRGTPLFVQIMLIHLAVIPSIFGASKGVIVSGIVALSLNSAAYIAEIFRAGIQSIDRGQMEASRSLGMTHAQTMINVILPQAFKRMIPPLGNEFISLLKDSSLLAAIAAPELANAARIVNGAVLRPWEAYLPVTFLYLCLTLLLTRLLNYLETRLSNNYKIKKREIQNGTRLSGDRGIQG